MSNELKHLPNGCSKKQLEQLFPYENQRNLRRFVSEIHEAKSKSKFKREISAEELSEIIVEYTGLPFGYADTFADGENYLDKYKKIQHRLKIKVKNPLKNIK